MTGEYRDDEAPTIVPTSTLGALLVTLLDCVCTALTDAGRPVCRCAVRWAIQWPSMTGCKCPCTAENDEHPGANGEAWTQLARREQMISVTTASGAQCATSARAVVNVGFHRCVTSVTDGGAPPSPEQYTLDSLGLLADEQAIRHAIRCCTAPGWNITDGNFQPLGPSGGCAGGFVQAVAVADPSYRPPKAKGVLL